jgi:hypothetical protein
MGAQSSKGKRCSKESIYPGAGHQQAERGATSDTQGAHRRGSYQEDRSIRVYVLSLAEGALWVELPALSVFALAGRTGQGVPGRLFSGPQLWVAMCLWQPELHPSTPTEEHGCVVHALGTRVYVRRPRSRPARRDGPTCRNVAFRRRPDKEVKPGPYPFTVMERGLALPPNNSPCGVSGA